MQTPPKPGLKAFTLTQRGGVDKYMPRKSHPAAGFTAAPRILPYWSNPLI
jgi:hypothetical protein